MKRGLLFAGAMALFIGGCATSGETERKAEIHDQRARSAASVEAYDTAAAEKHEADRLHAKAARQAADDGTVIVAPAPPAVEVVPAPPPVEPVP
jgi:hypothetical protein